MSRPSTRPFPPRTDYASLSLRDLLDAREANHVYLSTLDNVVATAIGRYLIHREDWYATHAPNEPRPKDFPRVKEPRSLENSVVRPWSWPCVLVFVRRWEERAALGSQEVPRALYLPDGRVIPTCVVLAAPDEAPPPRVPGPSQASGLFGGGYSCIRNHQGANHTGTIACLVSRGGSYYALTNRHVAGEGGEEVAAYAHGEYHTIGKSAGISSGKLTMPQAFPAWPGVRTHLTLDAGLIRIDDITQWTSQAFGIGEIGEPFDATECTVVLDLIGCPLRAFGGTSGVIEGEIRALFFRYESLGGIDRSTDLLIGPATEKNARGKRAPFTRPGDSGTLWFYDPPSSVHPDEVHADVDSHLPPERGKRARRLRPVAMQWGGQRFRSSDGEQSAFALASFVSTVCRELDVDIVRDWSTGHDEYWGKLGHFAVGWKTCDRVDGKLGTLMSANQARIGFGDEVLGKGSAFKMGRGAFVPLADVPDYAWVNSRRYEPIQHFADIDIYDIEGGDSLLERGVTDPSSVAASVWKSYFDGFAEAGVGPEEGVLPFRVWQLWDLMVASLADGNVLAFVAAAGVLAHYVGDASQPLHCSYMHHGHPPMLTRNGRKYPVPRDSDKFKAFKETSPAEVHAIYEQGMIEVDTPAVLAGVDHELASMPSNPDDIQSGHDAAVEILRLMHAAQARLSPDDIIDADDPSLTRKPRSKALWANAKVRKATMISLADSVRLLADLWTSAWRIGGGDNIADDDLREFTEEELETLYRDYKFAESLSLKHMVEMGTFEPE